MSLHLIFNPYPVRAPVSEAVIKRMCFNSVVLTCSPQENFRSRDSRVLILLSQGLRNHSDDVSLKHGTPVPHEGQLVRVWKHRNGSEM